MSVEYYINKFVNKIENDFEKIPKNVKTNLKELYQDEDDVFCRKCKKAYDCTYTGNEDTSQKQHINEETKEYLRELKDHFNNKCILNELKSPFCANSNILNSKREDIFEGCMKVLLEIQQQSSISTPYMPYLPVSNLMSHTSPIHVSMPPRSPIHVSMPSRLPTPVSMPPTPPIHVSMPPTSPIPVSMPYFYPRMTQLPPRRQPQTYDHEFLSFLSPENRNSLRFSPNPQETLKRMLNFNPNNVFNEGVKKRRKTKKLKRQSNR
jgi:hypothetical protein